jgi:hypothetical protein
MTVMPIDSAGGPPTGLGPDRRPAPDECGEYYFTYIDQVPGDQVLDYLDRQAVELGELLAGIDEERSLHRYAPGKWSLRGSWSHVVDAERLFAFRAFWIARGHAAPQPSFDQELAARVAGADRRSWASHVHEFAAVRAASRTLFAGLEPAAWDARGIASDLAITVRALAWIVAGHAAHHARILRERYLAE